MKKKKGVLIFLVVGFMAILLCLPAIVAAGGSPNPKTEDEGSTQVLGGKQGVIVAVFTPPPDQNTIAVLRMDGHAYHKELSRTECEFTPGCDNGAGNLIPTLQWYENAAINITGIPLTNLGINQDYGLDPLCRPEILRERICSKDNPDCSEAEALVLYTKDVNNLVFEKRCSDPAQDPNDCVDYIRILNCDVKVSFVCPK